MSASSSRPTIWPVVVDDGDLAQLVLQQRLRAGAQVVVGPHRELGPRPGTPDDRDGAHDLRDARRAQQVEARRVVDRRLALGGDLGAVERLLAQRDEGDALGEHQRHQQVVAARQLADQHQRRQRRVRDAAVERPHGDQRERAGVDARIAREQLGGAPEGAAEEARR